MSPDDLIIPAVPLPERLHLLLGPDGSPAAAMGDRGQREYAAYSLPADAPGPTEERARQDLRRLETGLDIVWVDQAVPGGPGLSLQFQPERRHQRLRAGADMTVVDSRQLPQVLWRVRMQQALTAAVPGARCVELVDPRTRRSETVVLAANPATVGASVAAALHGLPHPSLRVCDRSVAPAAWMPDASAGSWPSRRVS